MREHKDDEMPDHPILPAASIASEAMNRECGCHDGRCVACIEAAARDIRDDRLRLLTALERRARDCGDFHKALNDMRREIAEEKP